ncbi:MAG: hypothetical protein J0H91_06135 [Rhodospirillales bacterium]|nr:hypothetical protein [Rhodospirillales bacterium]
MTWTAEHRRAADRRGLRYPSEVTDAEWALVQPMIGPAIRVRQALATRNPSRLCSKRVATVHIVMVQQGFDNLLESHQTAVIQLSFQGRFQTAC